MGKTVVLPGRDEMLRRLLTINDSPHLQQKFYPLILKEAGIEADAQAIVMIFTLAISTYVQGLPQQVEMLMYVQLPHYIDALIDDKEVAVEAKVFLQDALKE